MRGLLAKLFRDTAWYGLAGVASRFVGLILVPLYTRVLSPAEFGLLDLLTTTSMIVILVGGLQVESGIARGYYEAEEGEPRRNLVGTGLSLYLAGSALALLAAALVFGLFLRGYGGMQWRHLAPVLAGALPSQFLGLYLLLLRFDRRPLAYSGVATGDVLLSGLLSLLAVLHLHLGTVGILWALAASKGVWAVVCAGLYRGRFGLRWRRGQARELLWYSVPTIPNVAVSWIQNYGNRFIVVGTLSMGALGVFGLATRIASVVFVLIMAFRLAWNPIAMELIGQPGAAQVYARTLEVYLVLMSLLCVGLAALGDWAVALIAPPAYREAGALVGLLAAGFMWNGAMQIMGMGISIARKTYLGIACYLAGTAANLLPLAPALRRYGVGAAAVTFAAGAVITSLAMFRVSQRCFPIPVRARLLVGSLAITLGGGWLFSRWGAFFPGAGAGGPLVRLGIGLACWSLYTCLVLGRTDRRRILAWTRCG